MRIASPKVNTILFLSPCWLDHSPVHFPENAEYRDFQQDVLDANMGVGGRGRFVVPDDMIESVAQRLAEMRIRDSQHQHDAGMFPKHNG